STVERIELYESLESLCRVVVAQLVEVVVAKIVVNAVFIRTIPELGVVILGGVGPAEVTEAQADDAIGIGNASFVFFLVLLIEVITRRHFVIEQGHVVVQGLFVQVLLVERPAKLVERELIV